MNFCYFFPYKLCVFNFLTDKKTEIAFKALVFLLPAPPSQKAVKQPRLSHEATVEYFFMDFQVVHVHRERLDGIDIDVVRSTRVRCEVSESWRHLDAFKLCRAGHCMLII